eukprot:TRINITY_DN1081_c1_g1_i1.p1 TRINITY_DN1081_c1_g1~~TRINITY_DN1081_c1_g1_i1.p1  ORF type:complete len:123 (-),score=52.20 TRINITY_DN1081_c1_g1_i1:30-398(-)
MILYDNDKHNTEPYPVAIKHSSPTSDDDSDDSQLEILDAEAYRAFQRKGNINASAKSFRYVYGYSADARDNIISTTGRCTASSQQLARYERLFLALADSGNQYCLCKRMSIQYLANEFQADF